LGKASIFSFFKTNTKKLKTLYPLQGARGESGGSFRELWGRAKDPSESQWEENPVARFN
jgi:hypothetical protein